MIKSLCLEQAYMGSSGNGNLITAIVCECVSMNVCNAIPPYGHASLSVRVRVCLSVCVINGAMHLK